MIWLFSWLDRLKSPCWRWDNTAQSSSIPPDKFQYTSKNPVKLDKTKKKSVKIRSKSIVSAIPSANAETYSENSNKKLKTKTRYNPVKAGKDL